MPGTRSTICAICIHKYESTFSTECWCRTIYSLSFLLQHCIQTQLLFKFLLCVCCLVAAIHIFFFFLFPQSISLSLFVFWVQHILSWWWWPPKVIAPFQTYARGDCNRVTSVAQPIRSSFVLSFIPNPPPRIKKKKKKTTILTSA